MASDPSKTKFSTSVIAVTGLIGAIAGLLTVLHTTGVINLTGNNHESKQKTEVSNSGENQRVEVIIKQEDKLTNRTKNYVEASNKPAIESRQPTNNISPPANRNSINLTGYWYENAQGSRYYFNQDIYGNVSFQEYSINEYGVSFVSAEGTGTIQNNNLNVTFLSYLGYSGNFRGAISNNGNLIDGIATVPTTGQSLRIVMNRE